MTTSSIATAKPQGKLTATFASGKIEIRRNGTVIFTMISDCSAISESQEEIIIRAIVEKLNN